MLGITFTGIPIIEWLLVGYCDASFNNAAGQKSQLGLLITLSEKKSLVETCSRVCSIWIGRVTVQDELRDLP